MDVTLPPPFFQAEGADFVSTCPPVASHVRPSQPGGTLAIFQTRWLGALCLAPFYIRGDGLLAKGVPPMQRAHHGGNFRETISGPPPQFGHCPLPHGICTGPKTRLFSLISERLPGVSPITHHLLTAACIPFASFYGTAIHRPCRTFCYLSGDIPGPYSMRPRPHPTPTRGSRT
jgi:hypothetical protein